jgi:tripartite-type tricarboxylate transporter receptor subunit TctC
MLASFLALVATALPALGAGWPEKPVKLVIPYGPGGGGDVVGRPLAHFLGEKLGQPFVVDNRGGASGNIAMEAVAQSPADGYTLVLALAPQLTVNQALYRKLGYDAVNDFAPITLLGSAPYFLAVHPSVPAKNLKEFIEYARKNPNKLSYGSSGNGSGLHLSMELLKSMAGIELVHVPYKGAGSSVPDLLAGNIQAMFLSYGTGQAHFKSGRVRVLAVTSAQRSPAMPDIPTIAEAGVPGYDSGVWYALLAPKGTPSAIVKKLHDESVTLLKGAEMGERFAADGIKPIGSTPEELAAYIKSERVKWTEVVKRSGATVD